jgi:hypothetical protein
MARKMMAKWKTPVAPVVIVLLFLATSVARAQDRSSLNYGFLSPNTRNDLTIDEAIKNLYSAEESNLIKQIADLGCRMRSEPQTLRALGSWSDGAEHSIVVRINADQGSIRYFLSKLGQAAKQKAVLYFQVKPSGPDRLYMLRPRSLRNLPAIAKALDREGIAFRTLVPTRRGTLIYIVDLGGDELRTKVLSAAKRLRSPVNQREGDGEFIGDNEDAQKASKIFEQEIKSYESSHPPIKPTCRR